VAASLDEPAELVERATRDHIGLRAGAVRLQRSPAPPDPEVLRALGEQLDAHIRLEERELFPRAERVVPGSELRALDLAEHMPATAAVADTPLDMEGRGTLWSIASDDLNANVLAWPPGGGVPEHTNDERDVLLVIVAGSGTPWSTAAGSRFARLSSS